jgi:hypothetical protein
MWIALKALNCALSGSFYLPKWNRHELHSNIFLRTSLTKLNRAFRSYDNVGPGLFSCRGNKPVSQFLRMALQRVGRLASFDEKSVVIIEETSPCDQAVRSTNTTYNPCRGIVLVVTEGTLRHTLLSRNCANSYHTLDLRMYFNPVVYTYAVSHRSPGGSAWPKVYANPSPNTLGLGKRMHVFNAQ